MQIRHGSNESFRTWLGVCYHKNKTILQLFVVAIRTSHKYVGVVCSFFYTQLIFIQLKFNTDLLNYSYSFAAYCIEHTH